MSRAEHKYVLDSNLFIQGFRDPTANRELQQFHQLFALFEYLSAVVAQELRAGVHSTEDLRSLEKNVLRPFVEVGRLITPSFRTWQKSGDVLAALARLEGLNLRTVTKTFGNDIPVVPRSGSDPRDAQCTRFHAHAVCSSVSVRGALASTKDLIQLASSRLRAVSRSSDN